MSRFCLSVCIFVDIHLFGWMNKLMVIHAVLVEMARTGAVAALGLEVHWLQSVHGDQGTGSPRGL